MKTSWCGLFSTNITFISILSDHFTLVGVRSSTWRAPTHLTNRVKWPVSTDIRPQTTSIVHIDITGKKTNVNHGKHNQFTTDWQPANWSYRWIQCATRSKQVCTVLWNNKNEHQHTVHSSTIVERSPWDTDSYALQRIIYVLKLKFENKTLLHPFDALLFPFPPNTMLKIS